MKEVRELRKEDGKKIRFTMDFDEGSGVLEISDASLGDLMIYTLNAMQQVMTSASEAFDEKAKTNPQGMMEDYFNDTIMKLFLHPANCKLAVDGKMTNKMSDERLEMLGHLIGSFLNNYHSILNKTDKECEDSFKVVVPSLKVANSIITNGITIEDMQGEYEKFARKMDKIQSLRKNREKDQEEDVDMPSEPSGDSGVIH